MTGKLPRGTATQRFPEQDLNKDNVSWQQHKVDGGCWKVWPLANNGCWERGNQCSFHIKQPLFSWKIQVHSKICLAFPPYLFFQHVNIASFTISVPAKVMRDLIRDEPTRTHRCLSKSIAAVRVHSLFISHEIGETYNDMYIHATIRSSTILSMI